MPRQTKSDREIPMWLRAAGVGGALAALILLENHRPLRRDRHESTLRRNLRNMAVAAMSAAAVQVVEMPVTSRLTRLVTRKRLGVVQRLPLPEWMRTVLACLLLDYTLYIWHVLTHKVPFLWRFHRVHHADLDMDSTTGIRFHFGEISLSVLWRAVQVVVIGPSARALSIWNTLLLIGVMFHHSNLWLPRRIERMVERVMVTPRMHGIHHSVVPDEVNSNWSSGLTIWDLIHRTYRQDVSQDEITIGVPELRRPEQVTLPRLVVMPLEGAAPPDDWAVSRSPEDGTVLPHSLLARSTNAPATPE
jgi:sterol desaturase/sphingolipid hydroxylase (fatty acid hydroxylase superfamily)